MLNLLAVPFLEVPFEAARRIEQKHSATFASRLEPVRGATRDKDEGSRKGINVSLAEGDRVASFQDVEDLVTIVVDMRRWSGPRSVRSLDEREPAIRLLFADLHLDPVPVGKVERASFSSF